MDGGQEPGWTGCGVECSFTIRGFSESRTLTGLAKSRSGGCTCEAAVRLGAVSLTARPLGSQASLAPWQPPTLRDWQAVSCPVLTWAFPVSPRPCELQPSLLEAGPRPGSLRCDVLFPRPASLPGCSPASGLSAEASWAWRWMCALGTGPQRLRAGSASTLPAQPWSPLCGGRAPHILGAGRCVHVHPRPLLTAPVPSSWLKLCSELLARCPFEC